MYICIFICVTRTRACVCCVYNLTIHITIYKWSFLEQDKERGLNKNFIRE